MYQQNHFPNFASTDLDNQYQYPQMMYKTNHTSYDQLRNDCEIHQEQQPLLTAPVQPVITLFICHKS